MLAPACIQRDASTVRGSTAGSDPRRIFDGLPTCEVGGAVRREVSKVRERQAEGSVRLAYRVRYRTTWSVGSGGALGGGTR
jgi:hypothetical protein